MVTVSVLASGRGSNFQAILDHYKLGLFENVEFGTLIYNKPDANAKITADRYGIASRFVELKEGRIAFYNEIIDALKSYNTDLVCLAGWREIVGREFYEPYKFRIMNIHPALLPAFGEKGLNGMYVHEAVLRSGAKITGPTVFFVDVSVEEGPIILQRSVQIGEKEKRLYWDDLKSGVEVEKNRGVDLLANRVLIHEHRLYSEAIQLFADGKITVENHPIKERKNGDEIVDEKNVVIIQCYNEWHEKWIEKQKVFAEYQKRQWSTGIPLEVLLYPQS